MLVLYFEWNHLRHVFLWLVSRISQMMVLLQTLAKMLVVKCFYTLMHIHGRCTLNKTVNVTGKDSSLQSSLQSSFITVVGIL